jgi:Flp pilus assembly pilin Flp
MKEEPQPLAKLFYGVLGTIIAAAIIGQYSLLFRLSERLTAVETKLEFLATKPPHIATNP